MADPQFDIETDIERLEHALRRLKVEYDRFFGGGIAKQPHDLRWEVKKLIRRYTDAPIRKYSTRFHFNSLVSRYNRLSERWAKMLRDREEGPRGPAMHVRTSDNVVATCRVHDVKSDESALRDLHSRFLGARQRMGDDKGKLSFDKFARTVSDQATKLREKTGCEKVEFRVIIEDGKVRMKARPGR